MRSRSTRLAASLAALAFAAATAAAADPASPPLPAVTGAPAAARLDDRQLADQRGGLATPFGYDVTFGAVMRTYVDGQLVLQTRLNLTAAGPVRSVEVGQVDPDVAAKAAAHGIDLAGANGFSGLVLPGRGGATAVLQNLDPSRIANLVVNTANGRDIRQDLSLDLGVSDLTGLQRSVADARLAGAVADGLAAARAIAP